MTELWPCQDWRKKISKFLKNWLGRKLLIDIDNPEFYHTNIRISLAVQTFILIGPLIKIVAGQANFSEIFKFLFPNLTWP